MNLIEKCREIYENSEKFWIHDLINELEFVENLKMGKFPEELEDSDEYCEEDWDEYEDLDFENNEILSIEENEITICAGGDWQMPMKFTCKWNGEKLEVIQDSIERDTFYEGIDINEFEKIINK